MNALILEIVVPYWVVATGKIFFAAVIVIALLIFWVVVLFIYCCMRSNIKEHEAKDDTIDPEDF